MSKKILAVDMGASSGRVIMARFDGKRIDIEETHRFDNTAVMVNGTYYWDVLKQFDEIKKGIGKAAKTGNIDSLGIDTWGVDFGLLDRHGDLMQNPVHYRDQRTAGIVPKVEALLDDKGLYKRTGIQIMELNTIFQLYALAKTRPELLEKADCALLMPDLLGYFLTGEKVSEYSIASTTQLLNPYTKEWDRELLGKIGISENIFPDVVPSGRTLGPVLTSIREELGLGSTRVISTACHDTASAIVAAPAEDDDFIYISCGTWSLFGTEITEPIINDTSLRHNVTNEGGYGGTIRFLKNIIGLWLIQETRRQYRREGQEYSYNDLEKLALASEPFKYFIDPDAEVFVPHGNLPRRVREYCLQTGQGCPETVGEIMRCIYESIAMKYRYAFEQIRECTGKDYRHIHMIGGGTKDNLLCSMAASAAGRTIVAGPIEATALGNIAVQLMSLGEIADIRQARDIVRNSFVPAIYEPTETAEYDAAYEKFRNIIDA